MSKNKRDFIGKKLDDFGGGASAAPFSSFDDDLFDGLDDSAAIVPAADGTIAIGKFKLTAIGIEISEGITEEEADALGEFLMQVEESRQWWLGDWANSYIDLDANQYEASAVYKRLSERFGISAKTLKQYAWVCRSVPASMRIDALSFTHHMNVAGRDDMEMLLQWASDEGASVKALRERIKAIDNPPAPSNPLPPAPSPLHGEGEHVPPALSGDMPPEIQVDGQNVGGSLNANALREFPLDAKDFTDAESEQSSPFDTSTPPPSPLPEASGRGSSTTTFSHAQANMDGHDDSLVGRTVILPNGVVGKVEEELEGWLKIRLQNGEYTSVPADVVEVATQAEGFIVNREMVMAIGSLADALKTVLIIEQGEDADTAVYDKALSWCEWLLGLTYAKARQYEFARLEAEISEALKYLTAISEDSTLYFEDVTAKAVKVLERE